MTVKVVIDRVEDGTAVLLVGDEEREVLVPTTELPEGSVPGVWLDVELEGDRIVRATVDVALTEKRRRRARGLMDRLLRRRPPEAT